MSRRVPLLPVISAFAITVALSACSQTPTQQVPEAKPKPKVSAPPPKVIVQAPRKSIYIPPKKVVIKAPRKSIYIPPKKVVKAKPKPRPPVVNVSHRPAGNFKGSFSANRLGGDFANNAALLAFINRMSRRHGFSRTYLLGVFSQARHRDWIAKYWRKSKPKKKTGPTGGWNRYRAIFVKPSNISKGVAFWQRNRATLQRASRQYRVAPEYIVAIMGVETIWGGNVGKHRVIDALTTSALTNKRRSKFFFSELEKYLLMTRNERMNPLQPKGSFAGAMGLGQFMPSSFHAYAVDFDRNGVRDLWNVNDAIGSIANYFSRHGWHNGEAVTVPANVRGNRYRTIPWGYKVKYSTGSLAGKGITAKYPTRHSGRVSYIRLNTYAGPEPWIGYHNFYVITRYNHSNYYAMAVHQLAQAIKQRMSGRRIAKR